MSCGLDASSCHVSTRAVRLSFVSTIHCWMAADLSLTERVLWSQFADLLITLDYVRPTTQWRIQRGGQGGHAPPRLEATHVQTLPLKKSVESKAGKTRF